jgi:hypothetical protein
MSRRRSFPATPFLFTLLLAFLVQVQATRAELRLITGKGSDHLIIFVHGLWGDANASFKPASGASWPELMANDSATSSDQISLSSYDTMLLTFSEPSSQNAQKETIPQIAAHALSEIEAAGLVDRYKRLVFIGYSAGGLVLKSMIIQASVAKATSLIARTEAIFLVSTPAEGPPGAGFLMRLAAKHPLLATLAQSEVGGFLEDLDSLWTEFLTSRDLSQPLRVFCAHETQPTFGLAVQGDQFASSGCDGDRLTIDANHLDVAKPTSTNGPIYQWVKAKLAEQRRLFPLPGATVGAAKSLPTMSAAAAEAQTLDTLSDAQHAPGQGEESLSLPGGAPQNKSQAATAGQAVKAPVTEIAPAQSAPVTPPSSPVTADAEPATTPPANAQQVQAARPSMPTMAQEGGVSTSRKITRGNHVIIASSARAAPAVNGDWVFTIGAGKCDTLSRQWGVHISNRTVSSTYWTFKLDADGKIIYDGSDLCSRERIIGRVSGTFGSGTYIYHNDCLGLFCRAHFTLRVVSPGR